MINLDFYLETISLLKTIWGSKVKDYIEESDSDTGKIWKYTKKAQIKKILSTMSLN